MSDRSTSIDVQIGEKLFQARQAAGLTVEIVAKQSGLSVRQMIGIELGDIRVDAKSLSKLARILGIEIREFFGQYCSMQHQNAQQFVSTAKHNPALLALLQTAKDQNFIRRVA